MEGEKTATVSDMTRLILVSYQKQQWYYLPWQQSVFTHFLRPNSRCLRALADVRHDASAISQRFYRAFIMIPETPRIALLNRNPFVRLVARGRALARERSIGETIPLDKREQEWHVE